MVGIVAVAFVAVGSMMAGRLGWLRQSVDGLQATKGLISIAERWCDCVFFFQAEDGIRDHCVTGVQTCALPIFIARAAERAGLEKSAAVGSTSEAANLLADIAEPGDLVLIKGSRLARTEEVIEHFGTRQSSLVTGHRSEERRVGKEWRYRWRR